MPQLRVDHPAFFSHFVPPNEESKYVTSVHGDALDSRMSRAEAAGWTFEMLHPSWTPTLSKRYRGSCNPTR
jgi:hypothetical protein